MRKLVFAVAAMNQWYNQDLTDLTKIVRNETDLRTFCRPQIFRTVQMMSGGPKWRPRYQDTPRPAPAPENESDEAPEDREDTPGTPPTVREAEGYREATEHQSRRDDEEDALDEIAVEFVDEPRAPGRPATPAPTTFAVVVEEETEVSRLKQMWNRIVELVSAPFKGCSDRSVDYVADAANEGAANRGNQGRRQPRNQVGPE